MAFRGRQRALSHPGPQETSHRLPPGAVVEIKERVMSTAIQAPPPQAPTADAPYDLTIDLFSRMVETGLIPPDRRIYLQDGRLYEKMAKTRAHGSVGAAINRAVGLRLPDDCGASGPKARSSWTPRMPRCPTSPWSAPATCWVVPPPSATRRRETSAC